MSHSIARDDKNPNVKANIVSLEDILNQFPQPWHQLLSYSAEKNSPYSNEIEKWLNEYHDKTGLDWNALVKALMQHPACPQSHSLPVLLWLPLHVQRSLLYYIHRHYYAVHSEYLIHLVDSLNKHHLTDSWSNMFVRMLKCDIDKRTLSSSNNYLTMSMLEMEKNCLSSHFKNDSAQICNTLKTVGPQIQLLNSTTDDIRTVDGASRDNMDHSDSVQFNASDQTSRSTPDRFNNSDYHDREVAVIAYNQPLQTDAKFQAELSGNPFPNTTSHKRKAPTMDSDVDSQDNDSKRSNQETMIAINKAEDDSVARSNIGDVCEKLKELLMYENEILIQKMDEPDYQDSFISFLTSSFDEMQIICQQIQLNQVSLEKLATISRLYCYHHLNANLDNCRIFCQLSIYPHLSVLNSSAPRELFYCIECFLKRYSEPFIDGCCLQLWNNELQPAQVELIKTLIETSFSQDNCFYFLTQIIQKHHNNTNKSKWDENHYIVIQGIIQKRLKLDSKTILELLSILYQNALDMASSTNFITLIINIINNYKEQIIPYTDLLYQILQNNKTLLKRSTLAKLKRLRSS
ncbi:uncharacterized protein TRIADDRAFT_52119 [Trichoplax adhaerens]|uniref:Fanconi Anaemia group E protein C-terminal domain-containing protein n=1 Tax=Trichoplax adhaerens TaxID=10228 RepID=B3RLT7_TRIAD|nr:predicted protein [Trichoplax adhaerens]EDV29582.1 predicted protein [Trichoplax adhaerens]|eukprot:XP_002108784.1 predicted protein [Trichoplax adhaerens]